MTEKAITLKFVVPEVLAVAFGIIILTGIVYFKHKYPVPTVRADANRSVVNSRGSDDLPMPDGRLSRVRLLVSGVR